MSFNLRSYLIAGLMMLCGGAASASSMNLVVNGDFSNGNLGFTSDYSYQPDLGSPDDMWNPGLFTIDDSAVGRHSYWVPTGDHTGGGAMLLANGDTESASTVWRQTVAVTADTTYFFSTWAMNLCCNIPVDPGMSQLALYINGEFLRNIFTNGPGVWEQSEATWFSAGSALAMLEVRNSSRLYGGNDFALDDLYLGTGSAVTPEPATMGLLLTGLGVALRRRYHRS